MTAPETATNTQITIRRMDLTAADQSELSRLAALDSHDPLRGPVLGIEIEGALRAAISVDDGELIADPFRPTSELGALLELRAGQLRQRRPRWSKRRRGSRVAARSPRLALGGSPPGEIVSLMRGR